MAASDFWSGLASMSSGAGLLADWRRALGSNVDLLTPFLKPTSQRAESYPCAAAPRCQCRHEVRDTDWGLVAACTCGSDECDPVPLEPADLAILAVDMRHFGSAICRALGFAPLERAGHTTLRLHEIGMHEPLRAPVYMSLSCGGPLLGDIEDLFHTRPGPFLFLTPTDDPGAAGITRVLERRLCAHLPLSHFISPEAGGRFTIKAPIQTFLAAFEHRVAAAPHHGEVLLQQIHREIAAVRNQFTALLAPNDHAEGDQSLAIVPAGQEPDPPSLSTHSKPRHFALHKGMGLWRLTFEGRTAEFKHEQGAFYVAWLLFNAPPQPIHGLDLASRIPAIYRRHLGLTELVDPVTSRTAPLESHARLQERNLGLDDAQALRALLRKEKELEAILDDADASEPEKAEALRELEAIAEFQEQHGRRTEGNAEKAARAVRAAITRFHQHLLDATDAQGNPHRVLGRFADHVDKYIMIPSARYGIKGGPHGRAGMAGCFTYEPPDGVRWEG